MATNVTIHANPNIPWQQRLAPIVQRGIQKHNGLRKVNIITKITSSSTRLPETDVAIILGPNFWKQVESTKKPFIMMNRKFLGFGERDVHDNVAISWDGFNGRGTFCVDEVDSKRFWRYIKSDDFRSWQEPEGENYLLCKQTDTGRCKAYPSINEWYVHVKRNGPRPLVVRAKANPEAGSMKKFRADFLKDMRTTKAAIVLNSTVSTEILLAGVPVISMDEGDPTYAINSHSFDDIKRPERVPFFEYLAHCQWHYNEIENGNFWDQIYPKRGPRLCEWGKNV